MQCAYCGAENREDAAFCLACLKTIVSMPQTPSVAASAGWATPFYDRETSNEGVVFAGFWNRLFALILDTIFSLLSGALPGLAVLILFRGSHLAVSLALLGWLAGAVAYQVIGVAYGGGFGMRIIGIRVVRAEDWSPPGLGRATVRLVARSVFGTVPILGSVLPLVDNVWMIKDAHKQTWHDKAARTYVIER